MVTIQTETNTYWHVASSHVSHTIHRHERGNKLKGIYYIPGAYTLDYLQKGHIHILYMLMTHTHTRER